MSGLPRELAQCFESLIVPPSLEGEQDTMMRRLVPVIRQLSERFNQGREKLSNNYGNETGIAAYQLFYMPTLFPKWDFFWERLPEHLRQWMMDQLFIDVGSGPGTFSWCFLEQIKGQAPSADHQLVAVEKVPAFQQQWLANRDHHFPQYKHQASVHSPGSRELSSIISKAKTRKQDRVLFFGHSLNESWLAGKGDHPLAGFEELYRQADPNMVVVMEPGTPEVFGHVLKLRHWLLESEGFEVVYPCMSSAPNCALEVSGAFNFKKMGNWCHQILQARFPADLERFIQMSDLDRHRQSLILHVYVRRLKVKEAAPAVSESSVAQIIQVLDENKAMWRLELCTNKGGKNERELVEILVRDLKELLGAKMMKAGAKQFLGQRLRYVKEKCLRPEADNALALWRVKAEEFHC